MNRKTIALAVVSLFAVTAQANIQFLGTDLGQGQAITFNGNGMNVFAGKLKFQYTATNVQFFTVCGDLNNVISNGQSWNCIPLQASTVSSNMGAAGNIVASAFTLPTNNDEAAGLQVAVWEAVYDAGSNAGTPDFSTGIFQAGLSSGVLAAANSYYAYVSTPGNAIYIQPDPTNAGQGQLTTVPEPASFLALAGAVALVLRRRK